MIFYKDTSINSERELTRYLTQDRIYLLVSELEYLQNLDFMNFNYFNFEQDISDLSDKEFQVWFDAAFQPWLAKINEDYLDLEYDDLFYKFNSIEEKRLFLLKIVNFIMYFLPYEVLRPIFKEEDITTSAELNEYLNDDYFLITLRDLIIEGIERHKKDADSFVYALTQLGKIAKKNLVQEDIDPLKEHIDKQNFFFDIFQSIIEETDMEKVRNLIQQMEISDGKNLLS
jgi:hypothetical protein